MSLQSRAESCLQSIVQQAQANDWQGWDPYDALTSPLLRFLSFNVRWGRIAWIQLLKRSPINLRPILFVPKSRNPKALALFASSEFEQAKISSGSTGPTEGLLLNLLSMRSDKTSHIAWGYPFDWQSRAFFAPRNTPNVVVTSFCANAFLDGYEATKNKTYLETALGNCEFILKDLNRTSGTGGFCFSYTPLDRSCIHNANLLAAAVLCRTGVLAGRPDYVETGLQAAEFSLRAQKSDGSWVYGEASNQQWIDSFHTGFNLIALDSMGRYGAGSRFKPAVELGLEYYLNHFFLKDGTPRYFENSTWPIDIHSAAQAIITCFQLTSVHPDAKAMGENVLRWTLDTMWDDKRKHFAFQIHRHFQNRISYLRWADAWMAKALSSYLTHISIRSAHGAFASSGMSR